jgi:flavin reductase (DIM6/NTAB) family NADH-FMN oxidoreductase RutF
MGASLMNFEMNALTATERYKLLASSITPRPIAWITSQSSNGIRNAAPYSFFNVMAADPPIVALGLMRRANGSYKDTTANILETKEFVINLVAESDAHRMNFTAIDAPPEFDELTEGRIDTVASTRVCPPRIASAPIHLECRLHQHIDLGAASTLVLGEVLVYHIDDNYFDLSHLHIDTARLELIGRMHGFGYTRTINQFQLQRPDYAEWVQRQDRDLGGLRGERHSLKPLS